MPARASTRRARIRGAAAAASTAGGNQRILWYALGELLREARDFGKAEAPPGRPCLRLEDAIESSRGRLPCANERHAEQARHALAGLVSRDCLRLQEGWLWVP